MICLVYALILHAGMLQKKEETFCAEIWQLALLVIVPWYELHY
jgi:hypothetical protein